MHKNFHRPLTPARKFLQGLLKKRGLAAWCAERSLNFSYIFKFASGERNPSAEMVFKMREFLHPLAWFSGESEADSLPKFDTEMSEWLPQQSKGAAIARTLLAKYREDAGEVNRKRYALLYDIVERGFRPSFQAITKLKDEISPELWFC